MFLFDCLLSVSPLWPGIFQSLPIINGFVCFSVLGPFEYRFFIRYAFFKK